MSFNYDELKAKEEAESYWASYSDLFMVLSLVFLLLYVTASLRTGTFSLQKNLEYQRISELNEELKQRIIVYEAQKENYLETQASNEEMDAYKNLMSHLDLLQDEARDEKDALRRQAMENEQKEVALNRYQAMVKNIINSNLLSRKSIKRRDKTIVEKNQTIVKVKEDSAREITEVKTEADNKITDITSKSQKRLAALRAKTDAEIEQLKAEGSKKLAEIKNKNKAELSQLQKMSAEKLTSLREQTAREIRTLELEKLTAKRNLKKAKSDLTVTQRELASESRRKDKLVKELDKSKELFENQMNQLTAEYNQKSERAKKEFENKMKKQRMSAKARREAHAKFKEQAESEKQALAAQLGELDSKVKNTQSQLNKAKKSLNARRNLANKIKQNFKKAGIDAEVDAKTGDVMLTFGEEYFESGKNTLKPGMKNTLEKFIPTYAKSLFEDPKVANKLSYVEIVGYASPTYKGKFVDPQSINPEHQEAVKYNLDLSYKRARSIFDHVFNTNNMSFADQKRLRSIVKVSGQGFLSDKKKERDIASDMPVQKYCAQYNCKKAQRVIIKFDLED